MSIDFASVTAEALDAVGALTGLEQVGLCLHRHKARTIDVVYLWRPGGDEAASRIHDPRSAAAVAIPWRDSLAHACVAAGLRWTPDVQSDLPHTSWAHATGIHTVLTLPAGSIAGGNLYLTGQSRESLHFTDRVLVEAELVARTMEVYAQRHPQETREALRRVNHALVRRSEGRPQRRRVAIVDDDQGFGTIVEGVIAPEFIVDTYRDAVSALAGFAARRPDLVLLGADMRGPNGNAVIEAIRDNELLYGLNVIACSSFVQSPIDFIRAGFDGAIDKMRVSPEHIATVVVSMLNGWAPSPRAAVGRPVARAPIPRAALVVLGERAKSDETLAGSLRLDVAVIQTRAALTRAFLRAASPSRTTHRRSSQAADINAIALEFAAAGAYARALRQAGVNRSQALSAFREIGGVNANAYPALSTELARLEATCIEAFDVAKAAGVPSAVNATLKNDLLLDAPTGPAASWRRADVVAHRLRTRVAGSLHLRRLEPGDRLPGIRALARELSADHRTVIRACRVLESEGIIALRARSGIYVAATHADRARPTQDGWLTKMILDGVNRGVRPVDLPGLIDAAIRGSTIRTVCVADNRDDIDGLMDELYASYAMPASAIHLSELLTAAGAGRLRAADVIVSTAFCRGAIADVSRGVDCVRLEMSLAPSIATALPATTGEGVTYMIGTDPRWSHRVITLSDGHVLSNVIPMLVGRDDLGRIPADAPVFIMPAAVRALGASGVPSHFRRVHFAFRPEDTLVYLTRLLEGGLPVAPTRTS